MNKIKQPTFLNFLIPLLMIIIGLRHYVKHGVELMTIIPIALGSFGLYLVLFNHHLLQNIEKFIIKLWYPIGQLITVILLTMMFYLVFAPVGLILRLFKKDILNKNFIVDRLSYWTERPKKEQNNYTQQF